MPEFGPWVENELSDADAAGAKIVVVKSGASYRATGNAAHGPAILDANGHVISRLAYEGAASGVATLDANGAVEQDPASKGQANGVAGLDANGKLAQPRRVLDVGYDEQAEIYSTTAVIGEYIMPTPRVQLTLPANSIVLLDAMLNLDSSGTYWSLARLVYSDDGGNTWTGIGKFAGHTSEKYISLALVGRQEISSAITRIYGITIGNASGHSDTIKALNGYGLLRVMVVDF